MWHALIEIIVHIFWFEIPAPTQAEVALEAHKITFAKQVVEVNTELLKNLSIDSKFILEKHKVAVVADKINNQCLSLRQVVVSRIKEHKASQLDYQKAIDNNPWQGIYGIEGYPIDMDEKLEEYNQKTIVLANNYILDCV